jgi:hypothetical protein
MTESPPHPLHEIEAALAAELDRQRLTIDWIAVAESVVAPARLRAMLARLDEPGRS